MESQHKNLIHTFIMYLKTNWNDIWKLKLLCMVEFILRINLLDVIQDLLKLESLQAELAERNGSPPTFAQWAAAAGVDPRTLRTRLNYGRSCKDKMIKSNIRLVISIAKNYQGAGMNLQDLVQVFNLPSGK